MEIHSTMENITNTQNQNQMQQNDAQQNDEKQNDMQQNDEKQNDEKQNDEIRPQNVWENFFSIKDSVSIKELELKKKEKDPMRALRKSLIPLKNIPKDVEYTYKRTVSIVSNYDPEKNIFKGEVTLSDGKHTFYIMPLLETKEGVRKDGTPWKIVGYIWLEGQNEPYPAIFQSKNKFGKLENSATILRDYDIAKQKEIGKLFANLERYPSTTNVANYKVTFVERIPVDKQNSTANQADVSQADINQADSSQEDDDLPF